MRVAQAQSHWILMFRGSGLFASELAGENRQIVSSDGDTMFNSDPVGMAVLLKIARDKSTISFPELAREFGRRTVSWYEERHLARTEEPTFWTNKEKPLLLAASSGAEGGAGSAEAANQDSKATQPEGQAADLPGAWKEIKRVDAREFPDSDAVT